MPETPALNPTDLLYRSHEEIRDSSESAVSSPDCPLLPGTPLLPGSLQPSQTHSGRLSDHRRCAEVARHNQARLPEQSGGLSLDAVA